MLVSLYVCVNTQLVPDVQSVKMYYVDENVLKGHLYMDNTFYKIKIKSIYKSCLFVHMHIVFLFIYIICINTQLVTKAQAVNIYYVEEDVLRLSLFTDNIFYKFEKE